MLKKKVDLNFGEVTIHENILIAKLHEGVLFDVENNKKLLELGREIFQGNDYGYISYRVNSYAVDPMVYLESANTPALKAIAVVSENQMTRQNAMIVERKFYKNNNSFEVFESLDEAIDWMKSTI